MGKASRILTLIALAGLGGAYLMSLDSPVDWSDVELPKPVKSSPPVARDTGLAVAPAGWREFARSASEPTQAETQPASAPVVVMLAPRQNEGAVKSPNPNQFASDPVALTRELQRELKRVGCYDGDISGVWTPSTRAAMKTFTGRVNAALPTEEPDVILLTLVQGHHDKACGMPCPVGQGLAVDGRCLPNAILTQVKKAAPPAAVAAVQRGAPGEQSTPPAITGWSTTTTAATTSAAAAMPPTPAAAAPTPPAPEGRMALAGPGDDASKVAADAAVAVAEGAAAPPPPAPTAAQRAAKTKSAFGPSFFRQLDRLGSN